MLENLKEAVNQVIKDISIDNFSLTISFENGLEIEIIDVMKNCCEDRYMSTDDDLQYFVGSVFLEAEIKEGPENSYGHDVEFFEIKTSKGYFTIVSHNEHNGYYGGFDLCAFIRKKPKKEINQ